MNLDAELNTKLIEKRAKRDKSLPRIVEPNCLNIVKRDCEELENKIAPLLVGELTIVRAEVMCDFFIEA